MQIRYRITFDDYVEAQRAHRRVSRAERWAIWVMIALLLMLIGLAIVVSLIKRDAANVMWWFPLGYAVVVALFLYGKPFWALKFKGIRNLQRDLEAEIMEEKVIVSCDVARGEMKWEVFIKWSESKNLFLLYQQPAFFNILPKRSFPTGSVEQFRELLTRKVTRA